MDDEIRTLKAQIEALVENLVRAKKAMETDSINPHLREAVKHRFEWKEREREQQLETLRKKVDLGGAIAVCWKEFSVLRKDFENHFRECLAFLEGALIRSAGLDNKVCEVADALLRKLSHEADCDWPRFTIMAAKRLMRG
jgi:hypothetical protein